MQTDLLEASYQLRDRANQALDEGKPAEWVSLLEMAFTSATASAATLPVSFQMQLKSQLPAPVAVITHLIIHLSRRAAVIHMAVDLLAHPVADLRRFPLVGGLLSLIAGELPDDGLWQLILDISDGEDVGSYQRIGFSSARPDTLLVPDPYLFFNADNALYRAYASQDAKPWRQRREAIFWRGGSGGPRLSAPDPDHPRDWSCQQRLRLCQAARDSRHRDRLDIALSHANTIAEPYLRDSLTQEGFVKPEVPKLEFFDYRTLIDVDGWTNAWSLLDKMIGGAAILKVASAKGYRQWYYHRLTPWENFIPLAADLSDFDDILDWVFAHPDECEAIAAAAARTADYIQLQPDLAFVARAALAIMTRL